MKNEPSLIWVILALLAMAVFGLGIVAWALASGPSERVTSRGVQAALAVERALESTRQADQPPATPLVLTPESLRPSPTSLADFLVFSPTFTPVPAKTKIYADPAFVLGEFTWLNTFEDRPAVVESGNACARARIVNGRFVATAPAGQRAYCELLIQPESVEYYLEVTVETLDDCSGGEFGLFARGSAAGDGAYFGLTCNGGYSLVYQSGERGGVLVPGGSSPWVSGGSGQTNRIGLLARGDKIGIYSNGTLLAEASDAALLAGGSLGVFVRNQGVRPVSVEFDNLTFWDLSAD